MFLFQKSVLGILAVLECVLRKSSATPVCLSESWRHSRTSLFLLPLEAQEIGIPL